MFNVFGFEKTKQNKTKQTIKKKKKTNRKILIFIFEDTSKQ